MIFCNTDNDILLHFEYSDNDVLLVKGKLVLCCIDDVGNLVKLPAIVTEIVSG